MEKIKELREEIDYLDEQIIELLTKRFKLTDEIGAIKKQAKLEILNTKREQEILDRISNNNVLEVYKEILYVSKLSQGK